MAQAKTRGSKKSSPASARSRTSSRKPKASSKASNIPQTVGKTGKKVSRNVGKAASKAKAPLLAGGAALAGAAGGMAIGALRSRRSHGGLVPKALQPKRVKISSQDVAKAARGIGTISQHVADLTSEMNGGQHVKNGKRKSPVEVVLEGLTARR